MRWLFVAVLVLMTTATTHAAAPKLAVFNFEWVDTSLEGEVRGPRSDEGDRLLRASGQLRQELAQSGRFELIDISAVDAAARNRNLQACGGCDVELAQSIGADLAVTGVVQKVSNLILNMNIYVRDTRTGKLVAAMSADMRGNTDESWSRATSYLVRNRLLTLEEGGSARR